MPLSELPDLLRTPGVSLLLSVTTFVLSSSSGRIPATAPMSFPMNLPRDICREIAAAVRKSDRETFRTKSLTEWDSETLTLQALSQLFVYYDSRGPIENFERFVSQAHNMVLRHRYGKYLKRLVLEFHIWRSNDELEFARILQHIKNILSRSPNLQTLRFRSGAEARPLIFHLSSLNFSSLRVLDFECRPALDHQEASMMGQFLLGHPKLEEVRIVTHSQFRWDTLRSDNPLPNVEIFDGNLAHLAMLGSSEHLSTILTQLSSPSYVENVDQLKFLNELALLSSPFSNVTRLNLSHHPSNHMTSNILEALNRTFPALEHIAGLDMSQGLVNFMANEEIDELGYLPRLQTLSMSESFDYESVAEAGIEIPSIDEIEKAFSALRRIFPAFRIAFLQRVEGCGGDDLLTNLQISFKSNGEDFVCYKETSYSDRPDLDKVEEYHPTAGKYLPNPPGYVPPFYDLVEAELWDPNL
ncbi:hypothetical protein SISNIDRAFT_547356 [Sistotremastrum niveocremeum HHB9708]|uniref:F-box domain-containing protein n=1 Tax=Sistotremastrum niveocremeum HHB9708 TaxID=1314777 RepID=A0A164YZN6_9AGAM|nr:hypothetical protein SISNIDRAFT_547356 [Sistotremastrum niveocremeum HHB9708]